MAHDSTTLRDRRVLVTGGTTGIGRATVIRLAAEGARLVTFGRHEEELEQALLDVGGSDGAVSGLVADTSRAEDVDRVFAAVDERLGGIDILVACAAVAAEPIDEMPEDDWRYVVETNLMGYMACARAALERMDAQGDGHLVFVGSASSDIRAPGESVYSATKAGIDAFAMTLRKEVADRNIRVSIVQPGAVGSDMRPSTPEEERASIAREEILRAEDIAEAIEFVVTRPHRADVVNLRIEPRLQDPQ